VLSSREWCLSRFAELESSNTTIETESVAPEVFVVLRNGLADLA
jgi:hypothetical protein